MVLACGNQVTQFSSPNYTGATYSLSGSATDKTKSIKKALESADATSVPVESGMSEEEKMKADAEEKAILEAIFPPDSAGGAAAVVTEAEAVAAAAKAEADAAAKAAADAAEKAASDAAAIAAADAAAKAAADAAAQKALADAAAAKAANPTSTAAADALQQAQEKALEAARAAAAAAAKAADDAKTKASADAAAAKAAADAAKAQADAAAKAAAKRAHDRDEDDKKKRSGKKSEEEEREDEDDDRDFSDDGDFETALPRIAVGDDAAAFREACAQAMKVDKGKLVIAGEGKGKLNKDSVLVVYAVGGSLTVKPEGEKFRGLCVFASGGANVTINAGKTRVNGLYIYERGNNNKTNANFSDSGRFKSGVVMFSGNANAVIIKGVNDCKCKKLKTYGSPGSVTCGK
jgi:hypothetical protein